MRRAALCAAAALLLCAVAAHARLLEDAEEEMGAGRSLLQISQATCRQKTNRACASCSNRRIPGKKQTEMVCSRCETGWRLRKDGTAKKCDCAPGLALNATDGWCVSCEAGKYCLGGNAAAPTSPATDCPAGLATRFAGAKSQQQCFTLPGYGRSSERGANGKVVLVGTECEESTYNIGGNTAGCQKCGPGLTTVAKGSTNSSLCVAPAGSYNDKGVGKKCQKGTYTTDFNSASFCTACPDFITTATEGSTSAGACDRAVKGYYLTDATTAEACPLNTYSADETPLGQECTPCPFGWRTKETGADGLALCLAPPGYEQATDGANITECATNFYKADWNRNKCTECGTGLKTTSTGSVSKDACLVPAGSGLVSTEPLAAAACVKNSYGVTVDRAAVANARCAACPLNMYTDDTLDGTASPSTGYTNELECKVQPGWGTTSSIVEQCKVGTYNAGKNRLPCTSCPAGMTTLAEGALAIADCVIQAGWAMDVARSLPKPCDKGSYSTGGTALNPNATCVSCDVGFTTQEQESDAASDCNVCAAGYGGDTCTQCTYNSFSQGGTADTCTACADGTASRKRATEANMCYNALIDAAKDVYESAAYVDVATPKTALECADACKADATCAAFKHSGTVCSLLPTSTAGTATTYAFKVNGGVDYAVYKIDATSVGATVGSATTQADLAACLAACTASNNCELAGYSGTSCQLYASELAADYSGSFAVRGAALFSDPL